MKNILLLILFSISPLLANASDIEKTLANKYFTLKNVEVIDIEEGPELIDLEEKSLNKAKNEVIEEPSKVEAEVSPDINGQPSTLYDMENWQLPKRKKFKVNYKNLLGMTVVSFTYSVNYQAGGSYNGKGLWLTGINVDASEVSVMWGFSFNATSSLVSVSNMGTKENPIAAATLKVSWELTSVLQSVKGSESFHITGDNRLIPVTE